MDKSHPKERVEKRRAQLEKTECRYGRAFFLLQEKWVLFTLYNLSDGAMGFNEMSRCGVGVNPTTLSQTLSLLEAAGLVTREVQSTMPPKTSYELTEAGQALKPILEAMGEWSALYLSDLSCSVEAELTGKETMRRLATKSARVKTK